MTKNKLLGPSHPTLSMSLILLPSSNIYRTLVYFLLKNDKYLEIDRVLNKQEHMNQAIITHDPSFV
jgi:hypothetical protein